jgi:hypothetical protein
MKLNINDYYLDVDKLFSLGVEQSDMIYKLYNKMLDNTMMDDESSPTAVSIFNTLIKSEYLKNRPIEDRDEKLGDLING